MAGQIILPGLSAFAHETITVSTAAIGPDPATRAPGSGLPAARAAVVNPADQDIRMTIDGTTPTASVGMRIAAGDSVVVSGEGNVANLLMIREDGTNSSVSVTYLR